MPASGENYFFVFIDDNDDDDLGSNDERKPPSQYDGSASCVPYTSCGPFGMMLKNLRKPFPNVSKFL